MVAVNGIHQFTHSHLRLPTPTQTRRSLPQRLCFVTARLAGDVTAERGGEIMAPHERRIEILDFRGQLAASNEHEIRRLAPDGTNRSASRGRSGSSDGLSSALSDTTPSSNSDNDDEHQSRRGESTHRAPWLGSKSDRGTRGGGLCFAARCAVQATCAPGLKSFDHGLPG